MTQEQVEEIKGTKALNLGAEEIKRRLNAVANTTGQPISDITTIID